MSTANRTRSRRHKASRTAPINVDMGQRPKVIWWRAVIIVVAGVLAYANSLSGPFIYDDQLSIVENQQIRALWSSSVLFPERELPVAGRPVVNFAFAINYALGGLNVRGYHVGNILIHVLCGLVLFGIVRRTLELKGPPEGMEGPPNRLRQGYGSPPKFHAKAEGGHYDDVALAVALIWTLHPLNSEAVDYLTQRTESMMAFFYLLTLYAGIRALSSARARWETATIVACALGMACKESMVTAPVMVVLYDRVFAFDSLKQAFATRWRLYAGLAGTWLVLAAVMWSGPRIHSAGFSTDTGTWTYLLDQTVMITQYLRRAIWPRSLVLNYGWPPEVTLKDVLPYAVFSIFLLVTTVVALIRRPQLGFLGAWFFITLAPTSSFVPIGTEVGAERRMYLPLIALVVLAVVAVTRLTTRVASRRHRAVLATAFVAVSIALAAGTMSRNREYVSSSSLARTVLERYPTGMAHLLVGVELMATGNHDEATRHLREAVRDAPRAHYSLGVELFNQGKLDEAIEQFREFIRKQPLVLEVISAHEYIGHAYAKQQRWKDAAAEFRQLLTKTPGNIDAQNFLGEALFAQQNYDEAIGHYRRYLRARTYDIGALQNLGIALVATGKMDEAVAVFRRAVEIDPRNGAIESNLANALFDSGHPAEAAPHARQAAALRPDDPAAHDVYGRALALEGKFDQAASEFERSLQLDPNYADARDHLARIRRIK